MTLTASTMLPLGSPAPDFTLLDAITDQEKSLSALKSKKGTLIMFICNHCPFVKHVQAELVKLSLDYQKQGIAVIAINANDAEQYPEDSKENMKIIAKKHHYPFPYLYDETQKIAKAYQAACTPDFFLFDSALKCVYRGQLDDSRPGNNSPVTGKDLRQALDALLSSKPISKNQKPSMGCNIKWKS